MNEYYINLYDRTKKLLERIEKIRYKELGEFNEEYKQYLIENHSQELQELEDIGKAFFQDSFKETYFYNSKNCLVGMIFVNSDGVIEQTSLIPLLQKISMKIKR